MAERRMFAKTIIDSDAFLDMPLSSQALYFHLSMRADDDGFLNNPMKIMRSINGNKNDYDLLVAKNFILTFDTGVMVIKHWRLHNYIRSDRYKETVHLEEKSMIKIKENGAYTLSENLGIPSGDSKAYQMETQVRLGKDSIGKDSIDKENTLRRFTPPSVEEVRDYCNERQNNIDPQQFIDFYAAKGWMIGKNKMKDWQASIRTWEQKRGYKPPTTIDVDAEPKELEIKWRTNS